jgi:hypothetical protein
MITAFSRNNSVKWSQSIITVIKETTLLRINIGLFELILPAGMTLILPQLFYLDI